ncbi:MAG: VOC family protein [Acidobacteria bacterium]|nr:VOC family protein [Acidobacteriota bacterium]
MRIAAALLTLAAASAAELPIKGIVYSAFRVSDTNRAREFYTGVLGFSEAFNAQGATYYKVNDDQYAVTLEGGRKGQPDRFSHLALEVSSVAETRKALTERGITSTETRTAPDGTWFTSITDPDGHRIDFVEVVRTSTMAGRRTWAVSKSRLSSRLSHTGLTVADEAKALAFYRDKLGFTEFWRGGPNDSTISWINLRMPGTRGDYIELMLTRGQTPTPDQLGSMQHICLETPDIAETWRRLKIRGVADTDRFRPRIGRNKRWLANLYDPDGTRVEFMEPNLAPTK